MIFYNRGDFGGIFDLVVGKGLENKKNSKSKFKKRKYENFYVNFNKIDIVLFFFFGSIQKRITIGTFHSTPNVQQSDIYLLPFFNGLY